MSTLIIVANIYAKVDTSDYVKSELIKLIEPTRAEEGCFQYELHQDNENPSNFMFFEKWQSRELWQQHMKMPHLVACLSNIEGQVNDITVHQMKPINKD